jgi:hypothetical protein
VAKEWIAEAIRHPGALTVKAKAAGKSLAAFEAHPPKGISATTQRKIKLAKTPATFRHKSRSRVCGGTVLTFGRT